MQDWEERFQELSVPCEKCGGKPLLMVMWREGKIKTYNVECRACHSEIGLVILKAGEPGVDIDYVARLWNEHNQLDSSLVQ